MSKAVSISEGGKGRIFPQTDKLKINNVGGGNSLWLPEDEVVTGTLYADENGIYLAENDGFSCYDTVVVRVEDETDPDEEDWELDLDEILDEEYEDVWDEESLEEFQEDPEAFEEKFNDKEKWKAEKAKKEKSQKIKKVKSLKPSKITGIDPVDGNPYQVGVDPDGNLTKEMLPSSIHIVVAPWKKDYVNGEEINFYGMHVYLLDKDGHPFKNDKYPTGEIPFEELQCDPIIADGSGGGIPISNVYAADTHLLGWKTTGWPRLRDAKKANDGNAYTAFVTYYKDNQKWNGPLLVGKSGSSVEAYYREYDEPTDTWTEYINWPPNGTYRGFAYATIAMTLGEIEIYDRPLFGTFQSREAALDAIIDVIGDGDGEIEANKVTVSWARSDGEILEDSFYINITDSGSENDNSGTDDSGSEHSGTSDSGSGHSSGGF